MQNKPQHTKPLARGEESEQEQWEQIYPTTKYKRFKKGKGKQKAMAPVSTNVLTMNEILELSIVSMESINFSCYDWSETVEWFLDSGSTEHITPFKSDFVQYREFAQKQYVEITDRKHFKLEGFGTVIGHNVMPRHTAKIEI